MVVEEKVDLEGMPFSEQLELMAVSLNALHDKMNMFNAIPRETQSLLHTGVNKIGGHISQWRRFTQAVNRMEEHLKSIREQLGIETDTWVSIRTGRDEEYKGRLDRIHSNVKELDMQIQQVNQTLDYIVDRLFVKEPKRPLWKRLLRRK